MKKALFILLIFISGIAFGQGNFFWSYNAGEPVLQLDSVSQGYSSCNFTVYAKITSTRGQTITERGIVSSSVSNPTISNTKTVNGTGIGSYITSIPYGARVNRYFRAYVTTNKGTYYSNQIYVEIDMSLSITVNARNITHNSAEIYGTVDLQDPYTVNRFIIQWGLGSLTEQVDADLAGDGTFSVLITGLSATTNYYYAAGVFDCVGIRSQNGSTYFTTTTAPVDPTAPEVNTTSYNNVTSTGFIVNGEVYSDGGASVTERGVVIDTSTYPTTDSNLQKVTSGTGTGTFSSTFSSLTSNTVYYARAYAINSVGTSYGQQFEITTLTGYTTPVVVTSSVANISKTTATAGGNVTDDGGDAIIERGVVYGLSANPTIFSYIGKVSNGTGEGSFTTSLTNLQAGTTYHVRAYGTSNTATGYGADSTFTTSPAGLVKVTAVIVNNNAYSPKFTEVTLVKFRDKQLFNVLHQFNTINDSYFNKIQIVNQDLYPVDGDSISIEIDYNSTPPPPPPRQNFESSLGHRLRYLNTNIDYNEADLATILTNSTEAENLELVNGGNGSGDKRWRAKFKLNLNTVTNNYLYFIWDFTSTAPTTKIPVIETQGAVFVTNITGTVPYNIISDGGSTITQAGICYNTTGNPTINDSYVNGTGLGEGNLIDLLPNTTYYARAFAVNSVGTGYGAEIEFTTDSSCPSLGDLYQGGKVAYIFQSGDLGYIPGECHGIIAATADLSNAAWGCDNVDVPGASGTAIGTGMQNTIDILNGCATAGIAARLCADYVSGIYSDWFLPSKDELLILYANKTGIGGFANDYYWSSTEDLCCWAKGVSFVSGTVSSINKSTSDKVRPIRYF